MRSIRLVLCFLFACIIGLFAVPVARAAPPKDQPPTNTVFLPLVTVSFSCLPNSQEQALAVKMRTDPDQKRLSLNCDPILSHVARERAADMGTRDYFSHVNPDGYGPNYLVRQAGYVLPDLYDSSLTGNNIESIAAGYPTAEDVWARWMISAPHRVHLLGLDPFFAEQIDYGIGFAYASSSTYLRYWVVITAKHGP